MSGVRCSEVERRSDWLLPQRERGNPKPSCKGDAAGLGSIGSKSLRESPGVRGMNEAGQPAVAQICKCSEETAPAESDLTIDLRASGRKSPRLREQPAGSAWAMLRGPIRLERCIPSARTGHLRGTWRKRSPAHRTHRHHFSESAQFPFQHHACAADDQPPLSTGAKLSCGGATSRRPSHPFADRSRKRRVALHIRTSPKDQRLPRGTLSA